MFRLMAFALAVSGLCLGSSARADDAEDKAATLVEKLGGKVTRDEKAPGKPVVTVRFNDPFGKTKVTDVDLKELAALKNLTTLTVYSRHVTDAGLKELAALKNLTTLSLSGPRVVTAAGLKELAALKNLTTLNMSGPLGTDAGRQELQKALPKCKININR